MPEVLLPLGRTSATCSYIQAHRYTHAEEVVHVTGEVYAENLDCHANPFVHTLPCGGRTSIRSFHGALRAIWDIH